MQESGEVKSTEEQQIPARGNEIREKELWPPRAAWQKRFDSRFFWESIALR